MMKLISLIFCFIIGFAIDGNAQNQIQFKHLNIDKGLSNSRVTAIVQDSLGFIWIGTKNGLNRYDGASFKVFNQKNSSISSDDISALKIDGQGKLWIGTIGGGISVYSVCTKTNNMLVFNYLLM